MKSDLSRYRTQLTQAEALELCEILDSVPEMSLALLKLHSKLKIFVAQVQMGDKQASYVPSQARQNSESHNGLSSADRAKTRKANQTTDPRKVLYHELLEDPDVPESVKNQLMTDAVIMDKYPEIDPRTGESVVPKVDLDIDEDSI